MADLIKVECPVCKGSGRGNLQGTVIKCQGCNGVGHHMKEKSKMLKLKVTIKPPKKKRGRYAK